MFDYIYTRIVSLRLSKTLVCLSLGEYNGVGQYWGDTNNIYALVVGVVLKSSWVQSIIQLYYFILGLIKSRVITYLIQGVKSSKW